MKKLFILLVILSCTTLMTGCGKGGKINGHTLNTANKSVKALRNKLLPDQRIEFELSFGLIRESNKNDADFLDAVDGKKPEEIIVMGKEIFQQRKNAGLKAYAQYASWDEMIAKFGKQRLEQENPNKKKEVARDKANDLLYDINSPNK